MVIAPVFGFDDYQDYYRKTQSGQFLKGVRVPFLAVQVCLCYVSFFFCLIERPNKHVGRTS